MDNKKILYISSVNPLKGPGTIAMTHYQTLKKAGFEIDFLTTFPVNDYPEIKSVLTKKPNKYLDYIRRFPYHFLRKFHKPRNYEGPFFYFYRKETEPPIPIRKVLKQIKGKYDLIIVFFWQGLMSYKTLEKIYNKIGTNPKVYFINADYSVMTGGCHFFCSCRNYETGCGKCPMISSNNSNDFTAWNAQYRKKIVKRIKPYVSVNAYTRPFFEKSFIFKDDSKFLHGTMILDLEKFKPLPSLPLRKKYNIPEDKFVILFGAQDFQEERKGMKYLLESLQILYNYLTKDERESILLVSLGSNEEFKKDLPKFSHIHLGYISFETLPELYSLANILVSPSINDPGPSMVNQSIACGTPVVAFEMGTALDVVKDKGSGICVPLKDTRAMAQAIKQIFKMDEKEYKNARDIARTIAQKHHSYKVFIDRIQSILEH